MTIHKSGGRKLLSRVLAEGILLSMYAFGTVATTGALGVPRPMRNEVEAGVSARAGVSVGGAAAAISARRSASASVRPSSAARSRRERLEAAEFHQLLYAALQVVRSPERDLSG